jgi:hypothetical protein
VSDTLGVMLFRSGEDYTFKVWPEHTPWNYIDVMRFAENWLANARATFATASELHRIRTQPRFQAGAR